MIFFPIKLKIIFIFACVTIGDLLDYALMEPWTVAKPNEYFTPYTLKKKLCIFKMYL